MTINCGITNDERRLGSRCRMIGCHACEVFEQDLIRRTNLEPMPMQERTPQWKEYAMQERTPQWKGYAMQERTPQWKEYDSTPKEHNTQFAEAVQQNLKTARIMTDMLKDDYETKQLESVTYFLGEAIKHLDFHIGELEKRSRLTESK